MKKSVKIVLYSFSFLFTIVHASSCRKDADLNNDVSENYMVAVKFKEFDQAIHPILQTNSAPAGLRNLTSTTKPASATEEGSLYYWSFNEESLDPDVAVSDGATITLNQGDVSPVYGTGWAYDGYLAGWATSTTGLTEILVKMPLDGISLVSSLSFDVGSSGTGAKSFALSYSQDGMNYTTLSENNQFTNTNTSQAKNSFTFQLATVSLDYNKALYIRLVPQAGDRGIASEYRETTGVFKLDNLRLLGKTGDRPISALKSLHYHVFDAVSNELVHSGMYDYTTADLNGFSLSLPAGDYIASFVTNESKTPLPIPAEIDASSYFVSNVFANHEAKIFGVLDTFTVSQDMTLELTVKRYYSEVKFEFTDVSDLSHIAKFVINRRHTPAFYAPFNSSFVNPLKDQTVVTINPIFTAENKSITFNQFIGNVLTPLPLSYTIDTYDVNDAIVRSFDVEASIVNNVQLVFQGILLNDRGAGTNFTILFNENWDGREVVDF